MGSELERYARMKAEALAPAVKATTIGTYRLQHSSPEVKREISQV